MKSNLAQRLLAPCLAVVISSLGALDLAAANLTPCDLPTLEAALQAGGEISFGCDGEFTLTHTEVIEKDTSLNANGHSVVIRGGDSIRLFQVSTNIRFSAHGIVFADAAVRGSDGHADTAGEDAYGAAFLNLGGRILLEFCTITNNKVIGGSGGTAVTMPAHGGAGKGAAIASFGGEISLTNCSVSTSAATGGQGNPFSLQFMFNSGASGEGNGGAIYMTSGTLILDDTRFENNTAQAGDRRAFGAFDWTPGNRSAGGALWLDSTIATLNNCEFVRNRAAGSGDAQGGAIVVGTNAVMTLNQTTLSSNSVEGLSAGRNNASGKAWGGAIWNGGTLTVRRCTVSGNLAIGGQSLAPGEAHGAGVYSSGSCIVVDSEFDHNEVRGGNATEESLGANGAIGGGGGVSSSGNLAVTNCTFAINGAFGGETTVGGGAKATFGRGAAVEIQGGDSLLLNVTLANNKNDPGREGWIPIGPREGVAMYVTSNSPPARLGNSILANPDQGTEYAGSLTDLGYNLSLDSSPAFTTSTSLKNVDPKLGALTDNGGPTLTMAPLVGSPARDIIPAAEAPSLDQRGAARPQGPSSDAGAVEADFVLVGPHIITPPEDVTVRVGTSLTLTVVASGSELRYQWQHDGNDIEGATTASLAIPSVQIPDAGTYQVIVSNAGGSVSASAIVRVDATPRILVQSASVTVPPGASTFFEVSADGPDLEYQWFHGTQPVEGATANRLTISSAKASDRGHYHVLVRNSAGEAVSDEAELSFDASALMILTQPQDQTRFPGCPASFSVLVSGVPPFQYQWKKNDQAIAGANGDSYTIAAVDSLDAGSYSVEVQNAYREVTSQSAHLTLGSAIAPTLEIGHEGQTVTLTFQAQEGHTYRLFDSADLSHWSEREVRSANSSGPIQFVFSSTSAAATFFKVTVDCP